MEDKKYMKTITVKGTNYTLKLSMRGAINLEQTLGTHPANVMMAMAMNQTQMPNMGGMIAILHEALQPMNHGMSLDATYDLVDDWFADGHSIADLIQLIVEVLQDSGLLPKEEEVKEAPKKASKNA